MIPARDDYFYITSTGRLARRLRRQFRNSRIDEGYLGWKPLRAIDLNSWLKALWHDTWPEKIPAHELTRIELWKELAQCNPPPAPLENDFGLLRLLDENFGIMVRNKIDPSAGPPSTPLVEWRRKLCGSFRRNLADLNCFHPSELPSMVYRKIEAHEIDCPEKIKLAGFDSPAPVEQDLFSLLETRCSVKYVRDRRVQAGNIEAIALPSPEQEVIYLAERLAEDARSLTLNRIGVVVPDLNAYGASIERCLKDVLGENPSADYQWFNITLGEPVSDLPLVKAALLPLRFMLEGESRELFLSLLLSPYYGFWKGRRQEIARADLVWRKLSVRSGLDALLTSVKREEPTIREKIFHGNLRDLVPLFRINPASRRSAAYWSEAMSETWSQLSFPVISDEQDTLALNNLREIMNDIESYLPNIIMEGSEFLSWISTVASKRMTKKGASEDAGIQIMGIIESRGLDFDKVYVLDMNDRSLPQPVKPLPLLDGTERNSVQGGTAEMQHEFAEKIFQNILHMATDITLLRAEEENSKPLTPSPFLIYDERQESINIWQTPSPAWLRADWLRSAHSESRKSIIISGSNYQERDSRLDPQMIPRVLSMTDIETALACPYMFFAKKILGIEKFNDIETSISPAERGKGLHRILASFTKKLREENIDPEEERAKAVELLIVSAEEFLRGHANDPLWNVERRRWFESPGLLISWLDEELRHRSCGWRCISEETSFTDLENEKWPFSLRGRIDRIDYHEGEGILCLDYKTGNIPAVADILTRFRAPQLPVYLLALRGGKIPHIQEHEGDMKDLSAGYMQLKSAKDIKTSWIQGTDPLLNEWAEVIAKIGRILESGEIKASPFPVSAVEKKEALCVDCPFLTLCEKGLYSELSAAEEEDDERTPY
jgi:ATP-dependent helicase/nuclease subunit B